MLFSGILHSGIDDKADEKSKQEKRASDRDGNCHNCASLSQTFILRLLIILTDIFSEERMYEHVLRHFYLGLMLFQLFPVLQLCSGFLLTPLLKSLLLRICITSWTW